MSHLIFDKIISQVAHSKDESGWEASMSIRFLLNQYNNANPSYTVLIYITLCCHYCILLSWNRSVIAYTSSLVLVHTLHFFPRLFALYLNKHSKGLLIALFSKILKCCLFSLRSIFYVHMCIEYMCVSNKIKFKIYTFLSCSKHSKVIGP